MIKAPGKRSGACTTLARDNRGYGSFALTRYNLVSAKQGTMVKPLRP